MCVYLFFLGSIPFDITCASGFEVSLASLATFAILLSDWCIDVFVPKRKMLLVLAFET